MTTQEEHTSHRHRLFDRTIVLLIGLSPLPLWFLYTTYSHHQPAAANLVHEIPIALLLGCFSILIWIPLGIYAIFAKSFQRLALLWLSASSLFIVMTFLAFFPAISAVRREHRNAMHVIARSSQPLIDAIEAYRLDHDGNVPKTLADLTPKYLTTIPSTGASCCPVYRFYRKEEIPGEYPETDWMLDVELRISHHNDTLYFLPAQNYDDTPLRESVTLIPMGDGRDWGYFNE